MTTEFTPEQLRAKDAWVAEHVFGWVMMWRVVDGLPLKALWPTAHEAKEDHPEWQPVTEQNNPKSYFHDWCRYIPRYTTNAAASDALDDAIIARLPIGYDIAFSGGLFWISRPDQDSEYSVCHAEKKIARVLFAEKLFAK